MSQWIDIPLATGIAAGDLAGTEYTSGAHLVNLMHKSNPPGSRTPFHIAHTPGLNPSQFGSLPGTGSIRGAFMRANGDLFVIRGTGVHYSSNLSGWSTLPGTMPGTALCRMVDAGTHVVAVDGTNAQAFTSTTNTACSRGNFSDVTYQDGYTFFTETGSNSVYSSDADDPTTINALNFTTADALAGNCVGIISDHREVLVFKESSIEHYYNDGTTGFPLARSSPGVVERGCWRYGKSTIQKYENTVYWVGDDLRIYAMSGLVPRVVSTPWAEKSLFTGVLGANSKFVYGNSVILRGSVFVHDGEPYYSVDGLYTGTSNYRFFSIVMNIRTGLWHIRSQDSDDEYTAHFIINRNNQSTLSQDGVIVVVNNVTTGSGDLRSLTEGTVLTTTTRTMVLPVIEFGRRRAVMHEFELDMKKLGAGTISLDMSDDQDGSFDATIGAPADSNRIRWHRLGSFRSRSIRLRWTIGSKVAIMGARARISVGT